jgi:DNA-3-methyladenine glycosylase II
MLKDTRPDVITHLSKDKKLKKVIDQCEISIHKTPQGVFDDLISSIVSQQLSINAAKTIYNRFVDSLDLTKTKSEQILSKSVDDLRALGFSYQKAQYVHNVVAYFDSNNLHDVDWNSMTDDEIIMSLTEIKGVGKWTVEMILMFSLMREDVLPLDDLIIRNHMITLYGVETIQKKALYLELENIGQKWRPYRTYACRYLWAGKGLDIFKTG